MKNYQFEFSFDYVPGVMKRSRHALVVLRNNDGDYILSGKEIYPPGIYRFVGGGIDKDESVVKGTVRELEEELGLVVDESELKQLALITARITAPRRKYNFSTYLFEATCDETKLTPKDDIDELVVLTKEELVQLIVRFSQLPDKLVRLKNNGARFSWSDYGKLYAEIHRIGLELTR